MRMSCNGCRVLRKGCCDDCTIRPCLQWIKSPDSQANATLFLAKFYGRAGLINLIEAGPPHLRPALFRSLLYEACGRIVSPVYGSVGLLWSGNWAQCQAAVDAVLKGSPIMQVPSPPPPPPLPSSPLPCFQVNTAPAHSVSPLKTCDIRHVSKDQNAPELNRFKNRTRFKRSVHESWPSQQRNSSESDADQAWTSSGLLEVCPENCNDDGLGLDLTLGLVQV